MKMMKKIKKLYVGIFEHLEEEEIRKVREMDGRISFLSGVKFFDLK